MAPGETQLSLRKSLYHNVTLRCQTEAAGLSEYLANSETRFSPFVHEKYISPFVHVAYSL